MRQAKTLRSEPHNRSGERVHITLGTEVTSFHQSAVAYTYMLPQRLELPCTLHERVVSLASLIKIKVPVAVDVSSQFKPRFRRPTRIGAHLFPIFIFPYLFFSRTCTYPSTSNLLPRGGLIGRNIDSRCPFRGTPLIDRRRRYVLPLLISRTRGSICTREVGGVERRSTAPLPMKLCATCVKENSLAERPRMKGPEDYRQSVDALRTLSLTLISLQHYRFAFSSVTECQRAESSTSC